MDKETLNFEQLVLWYNLPLWKFRELDKEKQDELKQSFFYKIRWLWNKESTENILRELFYSL